MVESRVYSTISRFLFDRQPMNLPSVSTPFVAVDIGNTRLKFGLFDSIPPGVAIPEPTSICSLSPGELKELPNWLAPRELTSLSWWIGSVQRDSTADLLEYLRGRGDMPITLLTSGDLPLAPNVPRPDMVGIDRLLAAVAANQIRDPQRGAVIVDLGTAITVDLVSADGAFEGGAILPGIEMSARALHEFTDLLPLLEMSHLTDVPSPLGKITTEAMKSGLFWGAVGGARELIMRLCENMPSEPQVLLTGGAAPAVAQLLAPDACYVPDLDPLRHCVVCSRGEAMSQPAIAAMLTPAGRGAVASLGLLGTGAERVLDQVFEPAGAKTSPVLAGTLKYGRLLPHGEDVVVCYLQTNRVEIHCHGGRVACEKALDALASAGALGGFAGGLLRGIPRQCIRPAADRSPQGAPTRCDRTLRADSL